MWRPIAWSAVTTAALAALFNPMPALAAPAAPVPAVPPAVPDTGSRPIPLGSLVLPGQTTTAPAATIPTGLATTPALARIEKARAEVALLGDRLITLLDERDLAREQATVADRKRLEAQTTAARAQQTASTAASDALKNAAALPPGTIGSSLHGLGALAGIQRGEPAGEQAAGRQLGIAREAERAAITEAATAAAHAVDLQAQYTRLSEQHGRQQAALQKLERDNAAEIAAGEAAEEAQDRQLGLGYTGGDSAAGKAADPKALAALTYALAQRGDPYAWSEEGPDSFDCSGLMWAAYRTPAAGSYTLPRVSRDQYWATRSKTVDRYSLLPGDMLFFSSSNSWTGIHHVAMYAGNGMMVEAPRTGLDVRLTTVRWTRLFSATRVYGPVDGPARLPDLGAPVTPKPSPSPSVTPSPSPSTSTPGPSPSPSKPSASPTPSRTTTSPSPRPSTPSSSPSPTSPSPSATSPSTPKPTPTSPSPSTSPPTTAPSNGATSGPTTAPSSGVAKPAPPVRATSAGSAAPATSASRTAG